MFMSNLFNIHDEIFSPSQNCNVQKIENAKCISANQQIFKPSTKNCIVQSDTCALKYICRYTGKYNATMINETKK